MTKYRILNLYAGIGGNRKLWDKPLKEKFGENYLITAIEYNQEIADIYKDFFPNDEVIVTDAHQYLLEHFKEFDFIWSSPPCQSHSRMIISGTNRKKNVYPDMKLYQEIILLKYQFKGKFVIENVKPYYKPLILPDHKIERHLYWCNFNITKFKEPKKKTNLNDFKKNDLIDWLGFERNIPNIYIGDNHCNIQILRNCVHPETGLHILNRALEIKEANNVTQKTLFDD